MTDIGTIGGNTNQVDHLKFCK